MTHIFFATRGHYNEVQKFIQSILAVRLKAKSDIPDINNGEAKDVFIQANLQPMQIWSLVFPKEYTDLILTTLFDDTYGKIVKHQSFYQKFFNLFRWCLRLKKCPEYDSSKNLKHLIYTANVQKVFLGLKEDTFKDNGTENL